MRSEMLVILHALKKWIPYLMGRHFKVKNDHDSLKHFLEQILSPKEQQKWVTKMLSYVLGGLIILADKTDLASIIWII